MNAPDLKLFAFQPDGHGEPSFFVMAATEEEAREHVNAEVATWPIHERKDYFNLKFVYRDGTPVEEYYKTTVYERGKVAVNDNG